MEVFGGGLQLPCHPLTHCLVSSVANVQELLTGPHLRWSTATGRGPSYDLGTTGKMNLGWLDRLVYNLRRHRGKIILANAAALLAASWLPASIMVRTQTLPGYAEHALAYFVTGICLTLLLQGQRSPTFIATCISAYAAVLEFGQRFVPGRHAALPDFVASTVGGLVGVATCAILGVAYCRMMRGPGLRQPSEG